MECRYCGKILISNEDAENHAGEMCQERYEKEIGNMYINETNRFFIILLVILLISMIILPAVFSWLNNICTP